MQTSSALRPRATRLQFSLRLLLLAITAFAIGFPIWYRWPYQEVLDERDPLTRAVTSKRILNWQRQWGGDRLLHGKQERHYFWGGRVDIVIVTTEHYVRGKPAWTLY